MPLLELAAFRFGISMPGWMESKGPNYQQPRNRYNSESHFDLQDMLTNFGATRFNGAQPGGQHVGEARKNGSPGPHGPGPVRCRQDRRNQRLLPVRRARYVLCLPADDDHAGTFDVGEQEIVTDTKQWLSDRAEQSQAYRAYLDRWGDWHNPWTTGE